MDGTRTSAHAELAKKVITRTSREGARSTVTVKALG
jgi:hypothetical protein